jgi:hypothetical protein
LAAPDEARFQRIDGKQDRKRSGGSESQAESVGRESPHGTPKGGEVASESRQTGLDTANDGRISVEREQSRLERRAEEIDDHRAAQSRDGRRHFFRHPPGSDHEGDRRESRHEPGRVPGLRCHESRPEAHVCGETEELRELSENNQNPDRAEIACDDGVRNEFHEPAAPADPEEKLQNACAQDDDGHEGQRLRPSARCYSAS